MPEREREITLRFLAEPTDMNFGGKVHGGAVMKWIDQAGYACAVGWSGQYCVTVYVGGIRVEVNRWEPKSEQDVALQRYAKRMMELREDTAKEAGPHGVVL